MGRGTLEEAGIWLLDVLFSWRVETAQNAAVSSFRIKLPLFRSFQSPATRPFCCVLCSAMSLDLCHIPQWALDLGTSAVRLQVGQEWDSSGRKGTREKEQLARWLGVCPEWWVPGLCSPGRKAGRPGIRFQWALQVSSRDMQVEAIAFCMASLCSCPAAGQLSLHFQIS